MNTFYQSTNTQITSISQVQGNVNAFSGSSSSTSLPIRQTISDRPDENDGFITMTRNRHSNETVKLCIRGVEKHICKWDIKSKSSNLHGGCYNKYCKHQHLKEDEQLCTYYLKGYCSFDRSCKMLHLSELYPYENYLGKAPKGCKIITLNNKKVCVCEKWIEICKQPIEQRKKISCNEIHQYNDPIFKHLNIPICQEYLNGKCKKRNCTFPHPFELNPDQSIPIVPNYFVRPKKALCLKHLYHLYDNTNEDCTRGNDCNYAHNLDQIDKLDIIKKIDAYLVDHTNKIPIQEIFDELYICIKKNIDFINEIRKENMLRKIECPMPIPSNFNEFLNIWIYSASISRKENKINKLGLFDGPDSDKEQLVWGLSRRINICDENQSCLTNSILGKKIYKENICIHASNCKKGTHVTTYDSTTGFLNVICIDELMGKCKCEIKTGLQAIQLRNDINQKINKLKVTLTLLQTEKHDKYGLHNQVDIDEKIKYTLDSIKFLTNKLINTYCKIHLISNFNYSKLQQYRETIIQKSFNTEDFNDELPQLTNEELILLQQNNEDIIKRVESYKKEQKAKKIIKKFLLPFIFIKLANKLKNDITRLKYITSGAYKFISLDKFREETNIINLVYTGTCVHKFMTLLDFKIDFIINKVFYYWYKNNQLIDFDIFYRDITYKKFKWNDLGIIRRQKKDVIEEYNVKSEKDNYYNFWSWYNKIPLYEDVCVIGKMPNISDIINNIPSLFIEYLDKHKPLYLITFSDYISSNSLLIEIVALIQKYNVSYKCAEDYVKMNIKDINMSIIDFEKYNSIDIKIWINVNKDKKALNQELIDINTFLSNKEFYAEFFLQGWWKHYDGNFEAYKEAKQNGWVHINSGFNARASDDKDLIQKALQKFDNMISQNNDFKKIMSQFISCENIENRYGPLKKQKKIKLTISPKTKSYFDSDSDSSDSDSDSSDSDSDSSDSDSDSSDSDSSESDFESSLKFESKTTTKPPYRMTTQSYCKFYIYLDKQKEDRGKNVLSTINKTFIGPFTSETVAYNVSEALRIYNKNIRKGCMSINIHKTDETDETAATWHVEYVASILQSKINKMLLHGLNPNEWVRDFVVKICEDGNALSQYEISDFKTNLPYIPSIFEKDTSKIQYIPKHIVTEITIDTNKKINPKIKMTPEQIIQLKKDKKFNEELKQESIKQYKIKKNLENKNLQLTTPNKLSTKQHIKIIVDKDL